MTLEKYCAFLFKKNFKENRASGIDMNGYKNKVVSFTVYMFTRVVV
jgi:hypothetical protein